MPTNRKRRKRESGKIDPDIWAYLNDQYDEKNNLSFEVFLLKDSEEERQVWQENMFEIVESWKQERPGTRPSLWYKFQAPRGTIKTFHGINDEFADPRKMVSGSGIPAWEKRNFAPSFYRAVPCIWFFLDRNNLPFFESEASYLKRHRLLSEEEEEKLTPKDFESIRLDEIEFDFISNWSGFFDEIGALNARETT